MLVLLMLLIKKFARQEHFKIQKVKANARLALLEIIAIMMMQLV